MRAAASEGFLHAWGHQEFVKQRKVAKALLHKRAEWEHVALPEEKPRAAREPDERDKLIASQQRALATNNLQIQLLEGMLLLEERGPWAGMGNAASHQVVESKHPYLASSTSVYKVEIKNALKVAIYFDQRTALASGDQIIVFKQHPQTEPESNTIIVEDSNVYCRLGSECIWPGTGNRNYLVVNCNEDWQNKQGSSTIFVAFLTKRGNEYETKPWGFRLVCCPATSKGELAVQLLLQKTLVEHSAQKQALEEEIARLRTLLDRSGMRNNDLERRLMQKCVELDAALRAKHEEGVGLQKRLDAMEAERDAALREIERLKEAHTRELENTKNAAGERLRAEIAKAKREVRKRAMFALAAVEVEKAKALRNMQSEYEARIAAMESRAKALEENVAVAQEHETIEHEHAIKAEDELHDSTHKLAQLRWKLGRQSMKHRRDSQKVKEAQIQTLHAKRHEKQTQAEMAAQLHFVYSEYKMAKQKMRGLEFKMQRMQHDFEEEMRLLRLDATRFKDDAALVPHLKEHIQQLEDASFLTTRKHIRKDKKEHHQDDQLEKQGKKLRELEAEFDALKRELQAEKELAVTANSNHKRSELEMSNRIQELVLELEASAAREGSSNRSNREAEDAEDQAMMLGMAMGMDLGDAASMSLTKEKARKLSVSTEELKEDLRAEGGDAC
eukprot:g921.t1